MSFQQEQLKAIADAIREKEGSSDNIMPIDFPERIRAIPTGTSLPDGGQTGQALVKSSSTDGDVVWGNVVSSFNGRTGAVLPKSGDYTATQVGAVPTSRTVNGKALSSNITLSASDVGARPSTWNPTASEIGAASVSDITNLLNRTTAVNTANTNYSTIMARGIYAGTTDMTAGSSSLTSGVVYLVYE